MKKLVTLGLIALGVGVYTLGIKNIVAADLKGTQIAKANESLNKLQQSCPTPEELKNTLSKAFGIKSLKIAQVEPNPYIKGLCDVVIEFNGKKLLFYVDNSGRYILLTTPKGPIIVDLQTQRDLTTPKRRKLEALPKTAIQELEEVVAFTYGDKGKVVYLFTDPDCPFCQRLEPTLKKLADEGKIQVKVIFFPLPFHPHAYKKAVATVCQGFGWDSLKKEFWTPEKMAKLSQWQCKEGEELIKKSMNIAAKYGIRGTPAMITAEGIKVEGALPEKQLKAELGIE